MLTHLHGLHERPVHNTSPLPVPFVQDDSSGIFCCKHLIIRDSIADGDGSIIIVSIAHHVNISKQRPKIRLCS